MKRLALSALLGLALLGIQPVLASPHPERTILAQPEPDKIQELIEHGMEYIGVRYRRGGNSRETGLDCSGLVQNVFRNAAGLDLPRRAADMARLGDKIERDDLQPGDLVFFNTMRKAFSHVGIYVGDGRFLHAPSSGGSVRVEEMGQRYWRTRFNGARRLLAG
ncbi:MAG: C40 family peptidase [Rhodocyclaceae bacterium]